MASVMVLAEECARTGTPLRSSVASAMAASESIEWSRMRSLTTAESTGSCPTSHMAWILAEARVRSAGRTGPFVSNSTSQTACGLVKLEPPVVGVGPPHCDG